MGLITNLVQTALEAQENFGGVVISRQTGFSVFSVSPW
jgi:hypothetical protein